MQRYVEKLDEQIVRRDFSIAGLVEGWFFQCREVSAGVYEVKGTDLWGRQVGATGTDERELLRSCSESARAINRTIELERRSG